MLLALATAAALGSGVMESPSPIRATTGPAIALAGGLSAYSSAKVPYIGLFALTLGAAMLVQGRDSDRPSCPPRESGRLCSRWLRCRRSPGS